ncbi:PAS domain-containing protein [Sphingomonas sp.]|uniref:PAS domain-containing protein n=1 Tax=Sphingomonas sp. TaxID=28214 RepID=UPI002DD62046|nr:PAS domain-containing protein [Sphingomonas sp.]
MNPHLPYLPATWQCDLSDESLLWSDGVYALFGLDRARRPDRGATVAMYDPESRGLLEPRRRKAIASAGAFTFEARIIRPDGDARWMRISADTQVTNGRVTHLYGTKQDITSEMTERLSAL